MAPYADIFTDEQTAQVTFIQTSWGNRGTPVTAAQVAKVRKLSVPVEPSQTEATFAAGRHGTFPPVPRQRT
jgi:hypothetical protein